MSIPLATSPIVVGAKSEVLIFRSVESAAAWLEAIDVRNNEYRVAYDGEGRRLELGIKAVERRSLFDLLRTRIDLVVIRSLENEADHAAELAGLLRAHLPSEAYAESSADSVKALLKAAVDRLGYTA